MTEVVRVELYGDSIGKGVVFDETRNRYALARNRAVVLLENETPIQINNHARMGATTTEGLCDLAAEQGAPGAIAAIEFGGNDCDLNWAQVAAAPDQKHEARVPLTLFRYQLSELIKCARALSMRPLLIIPPPLDALRYFKWVSKGLNADAILQYLGDAQYIYRWQESYAFMVQAVARALACPLLDLRSAFLTMKNFGECLCVDGIHPNENGHRVLADAVIEQSAALKHELSL